MEIDAGIDNAAQNAVAFEDGNAQSMADGIREAGWAQVPWIDGEWPPMDQVIEITLSRAQWSFALQDARDSKASYEELGDADSVASCDNAIRIIANALS